MIQPPLLGRGEGGQCGLGADRDLAGGGGAAEVLDVVGVHGGANAAGPQIAAARAERVRFLDPDVAGVEREGVAALDALPSEAPGWDYPFPVAVSALLSGFTAAAKRSKNWSASLRAVPSTRREPICASLPPTCAWTP